MSAEQAPGAAVATASGDRLAVVDLRPARLGSNRVVITLIGPDGEPLVPSEVAVRLSLPSAGIEAQQFQAVREAPNRFATTATIPVSGNWQVEIDALVSDFEKAVFTTEVRAE